MAKAGPKAERESKLEKADGLLKKVQFIVCNIEDTEKHRLRVSYFLKLVSAMRYELIRMAN